MNFTNSAEHIVPGRFYLKDLKSGLQLNTLDPKRKLYVTRELHGWMLTWNVTRASYIQLDISSILSLLESNSETQSFAKDLSAALKNNLKNINSGHRYTVIVPSQKSWELLRQKYSSEQLQRIAANHVILNQHCSGHLIQSLENYKSLLGEKLEFICETDSTGKERHYVRTMFNDKHELTITDLTSSNGVAHIIEEPLIPFSGWSTYSPFQDEYKRFQADKEYRCRVARYHVVKSDNRLNNIGNFASHTLGHRTINPNEALITKNQTERAKMDEKYFRKNAPKNLFLVTTDNGWKDPRATQTTINPYKPELNMYTDKNLENYLLLNHIPLYLWGGDIGYFEKNTVHKFMSSAGIELIFWMDNNAVMRIGYEGLPRDQWPKVIHWNLHARDGIIWVLDGLLKCPEKLCPLLAEDVDYYDVYVMACQTSNLPGEKDAVGQFESRPLDIASRHPNLCTVVLQTSETTVTLIET
ncbi:gynecophoral canal protein [Schistosoma japonicum]|nr:gynecophoral canal protein [Schistosoma japonicum]